MAIFLRLVESLLCSPAIRSSVFGLPMDVVVCQQCIQFMFDYVPENNIALCAAHFKKNSFQNLYEFNAGFNKKLLLKHEAVSTLKPEAAVDGPQPVSRLRLNHFKFIFMYNFKCNVLVLSNASAGFIATKLLFCVCCISSTASTSIPCDNIRSRV